MTMHVLSLIEMVWEMTLILAIGKKNKIKRGHFKMSNISPRQFGYFKIEWRLLLESLASQTCLLDL